MEHFEFYEKILNRINATIYVINLNPYKVEWINDSKRTLASTGYTAKEIIALGESFPKRLAPEPDYEENVASSIQFFKENPDKEWFGIYRILHKDNTYRWAYATAVVFEKDKDGVPTKVVVTALDITKQLLTQESLGIALKENYLQKYASVLTSLSDREIEVIQLIAKGMATKQIAAHLFLSIKTIENHSANIKRKLNCKNLAEIGVFAEKVGLTE